MELVFNCLHMHRVHKVRTETCQPVSFRNTNNVSMLNSGDYVFVCFITGIISSERPAWITMRRDSDFL